MSHIIFMTYLLVQNTQLSITPGFVSRGRIRLEKNSLSFFFLPVQTSATVVHRLCLVLQLDPISNLNILKKKTDISHPESVVDEAVIGRHGVFNAPEVELIVILFR